MNLTTALGELRTRVGNPSTGEVTDLVLTSVLNYTIREIATKYRFYQFRVEGTIPTVLGTADYALPSNVRVVLSVWDATNRIQLRKTGQRFNATSLTIYSGINGKPQRYGRVGNNIRLFPTPDAVYSIKYLGKQVPADLVAGGDLVVLPDAWMDGMLKLGRAKYYDDIAHNATKAIEAYNSWTLWLETQPTEIDEEKVDDDSGVEIPTLGVVEPRYDWDSSL